MKGSRKVGLIALGIFAVIGIGLGLLFGFHSTNSKQSHPRIVATTYAVVQIADKLDLPLVGVPTTANKMPVRYKNVTRVGSPMNPSVEKIASLNPTVVYSVTTLKDQFGKAFSKRHIKPYFLNLTSVKALEKTVTNMGYRYHRVSKARAALEEINSAKNKAHTLAVHHQIKPKVLVLMGLPGASYMIGTNHSYVGNLVSLAGGKNVFPSKNQEYIQPNDEAIKKANPDVILRLEHALPKMVTAQFNQVFKSDSMWQTISAVKKHRVYDLQEPDFDATANMRAAIAINKISRWLYPRDGGTAQ
ncbi:heme ABC transporter substrate-binding protein IsdE [Lentilactobacillus hilgardii]|uniref:heme ABC transporter substrate-binding protein IsdE n=1 Tax=Lentilactobacillus hilgardii TaxID=1588 RepID=UPI0021A3E09F|nr:heme ABC transporter substrate-binding protein IsdE [Lentilactobacillus hilgardii]MCT3399067.1 heme ABC transporter substrate-binding protein IsdE [Lentilactobacillus hilgardii]